MASVPTAVDNAGKFDKVCAILDQYSHRIADESLPLIESKAKDKTSVSVCLGANCFLKGSQEILSAILR